MKKFLIAAGAMMLIAGVSQAQTSENKDSKDSKTEKHQPGGFRRGGDFGKDLNLSEDQKKQFKEINETYRKKISDIRGDKTLSATDQKTKTQALRKEQFAKTQALLTAEQKAKMAEKRKNLQGRDFKGKTAMRRPGNAEHLKKRLGLSEDQAAKIKNNQQAFREKAKAIRSDEKLTTEQKKEQMKELAKQNQENMKSGLTAEQLEKLKNGRKNKIGSK